MRLDKDYLMEMELLPHFEMRRQVGGAELASTAPSSSPAQLAPPLVQHAEAPARPAIKKPAVAIASKTAATAVGTSAPAASPIPLNPARAARIGGLSWAEMSRDAMECQACSLCQQRQQAVVGVGAAAGPWLFIGEGPGAEEDQSGEPFVGQAGKLLDAMLTAAGLQRGRDVYITNVVKCRPPGNRTPTLDEAAACAPYLDRQIDLIQPKIIVALGKTAMARLTGTDATMASLRGQLHHYRGIPVVATYHPSYLLRSLPEKLKAWEDLLFAKGEFAKLA